MPTIGDALFTTTQQAVLGLLYGQPQRSFYFKEILRATGMGVATIKRELERLHNAGIITLTRVGNQHHYQADPACPVFAELLALVRKTFGLASVLTEALSVLPQVRMAFVFGSVARGTDRNESDIDVLIVGDVAFADIVQALYPAQQRLGREINPKLYRPAEWLARLDHPDAFIRDVMAGPRLYLVGDRDDSGQPHRQDTGASSA
jgi:uncharacterized protein